MNELSECKRLWITHEGAGLEILIKRQPIVEHPYVSFGLFHKNGEGRVVAISNADVKAIRDFLNTELEK